MSTQKERRAYLRRMDDFACHVAARSAERGMVFQVETLRDADEASDQVWYRAEYDNRKGRPAPQYCFCKRCRKLRRTRKTWQSIVDVRAVPW